jgi:hypothetical protein
MQKRIYRKSKLKPEEAQRISKLRQEFASRPSKSELLRSGKFFGPMSVEEYLQWRKLNAQKPEQQSH